MIFCRDKQAAIAKFKKVGMDGPKLPSITQDTH